MLKKDKVNFIIQKLDEIYPDVSPPLKHNDTYTLLIAVLLSANTTDKSVNRVTPK
ncbi:MAG: endonuclease III, partial [Candidatus Neomarinimicrobiota bacterium]|nr:endonuclease III [Candidatus Neomarinimicrobiota bacterium]